MLFQFLKELAKTIRDVGRQQLVVVLLQFSSDFRIVAQWVICGDVPPKPPILVRIFLIHTAHSKVLILAIQPR